MLFGRSGTNAEVRLREVETTVERKTVKVSFLLGVELSFGLHFLMSKMLPSKASPARKVWRFASKLR